MSTTEVKAYSLWVVDAGGIVRPYSRNSGVVKTNGTIVTGAGANSGMYVRQQDGTHQRLVQLWDDTPPGSSPSSVVASIGTGKTVAVTWSTASLHPLWDVLIQYVELVPAFDPQDPPTEVVRQTVTKTADIGSDNSTYSFLVGQQAKVYIRFMMNAGSGGITGSNTVTFT